MLLLIQFFLWPLGRNALRLESSSIAFESLLPTNSASMKAYKRLATGLGGPGKMAPFRILVDGTAHNVSMDSKEGFDILHYLVQELLRPTNDMSSYYDTFEEEEEEEEEILTGEETSSWIRNIDLNNGTEQTALKSRSLAARHNDPDGAIMLDTFPKATYTGISVLENIQIPYAIYVASKICAGSNHSCPVEAMRALNVLDDRVTSTDRMATYIMVELSVSPFSDDGVRWLDETRRRIANLTDKKDNSTTTTATHHMICKNKVDIYVDGSAAIAHDAVQAVYGAFPWVIGISLGVVFCLLGLYFGSIVPPLRSVVSISCTLAVSFGSAVLVYQDGIFSSSHFRSLMAMDPELCWLVPIMSFSIMVGLALDYDVFLVSRIYEFRSLEGYQHQSSIVAGLDATGGIITAAGVIMAISFGSLLWSASPALDQWAFLVTTAVLLDTFVVRTVVVPILIGWTGDQYSWYPCRFEKGTTKLDGFDIIDTTSPPGESNPHETTLGLSTSSSQERDQDLEQSTST